MANLRIVKETPVEKVDDALDEALDESFPASDPPSWTLGNGSAAVGRRQAAEQAAQDSAADDGEDGDEAATDGGRDTRSSDEPRHPLRVDMDAIVGGPGGKGTQVPRSRT